MTGHFEFMRNEAGEEEGLNHSGVETFRNSLYEGLARECGQNSADAGNAKPVQLCFELIRVPRSDCPGIDALLSALEACHVRVAGQSGRIREQEFFSRALELIRQREISVLKISDSNTTGLIGPAEPGRPFHSLVKSDGVSSKRDDGAGGSFGIGKYAAYAASAFRTVFYSTIYEELGSEPRFLAQGKSLLMSHRMDSRELRRTGYWGIRGFRPVENMMEVPAWMRRTGRGTSIFVMGFVAEDGWVDRMRAAVAQSFMWAIDRGDLEVSLVGDASQVPVLLNPTSLASTFKDEGVLSAVKVAGREEAFDFAKGLYECLCSSTAFQEEFSISGLGQVRMRILVADGLPKRVMIVRNGLAITDSLEKFGDRLARFAGYRDFVAFVEPVDQSGRALLRDLENPQHNELSAERITDDTRRRSAERSMRGLKEAIRQRLRQVAEAPVVDRTRLDELSEFFADEDPESREHRDDGEPDPHVAKVLVIPPRPPRTTPPQVTSGPGQDGGGPTPQGSAESDATGRARTGSSDGQGRGGQGRHAIPGEFVLTESRNCLLGSSQRRLMLKAKQSGMGRLIVQASGLSAAEDLRITSTSLGDIQDGAVRIEVRQDDPVILEVGFNIAYRGPIVLRLLGNVS
jgi:hypothetical protein